MHARRVPELIALLDTEISFPTAPFDSEEPLAALTRLGMKSSVGPTSILQSAQYIAELGLQDPDQAHERCSLHIHPCSPLSQVSTPTLVGISHVCKDATHGAACSRDPTLVHGTAAESCHDKL